MTLEVQGGYQGCGGSDYVNGDRLRKGGDCANASLVQADLRRVDAAKKWSFNQIINDLVILGKILD